MTPEIAANIVKDHIGQDIVKREHLVALYLNPQLEVIQEPYTVAIGTVENCICHPREVFRRAIELGAVALVLAHNHPTGQVKPSSADLMSTQKLVETGRIIGIELLDHVIIGPSGNWYSIRIEEEKAKGKLK